MADRALRVVAELGRPETPEETAARRATDTLKHRQRQTLRNLILALGASLLIVVLIVLIVPRGAQPFARDIDVASVAGQAQAASDVPLVAPPLSTEWSANAAELRRNTNAGVTAWYVGYITPGNEYIGFYQGARATPAWLATLVAQTTPSDTATINDVTWNVYNNRNSSRDVGNARFALATTRGTTTFVLLGTATDSEFQEIATAIGPAVQRQ